MTLAEKNLMTGLLLFFVFHALRQLSPDEVNDGWKIFVIAGFAISLVLFVVSALAVIWSSN